MPTISPICLLPSPLTFQISRMTHVIVASEWSLETWLNENLTFAYGGAACPLFFIAMVQLLTHNNET